MSVKESLRILVVDDMATSRGLLVNSFTGMGIKNVFDETNVDDALSFMLKFPVHIVVADYNMPGKDGLQLLQAIRSNKQMARTGFILVSGTADSSVLTKGRELGMNNFIAKPFNEAGLKKTVEAVTGPL